MPKNTCPCPNPPGGQVVCETDQLAICRIIKGAVQAECSSAPVALISITPTHHLRPPFPPLPPTLRDRYFNWALSQITGSNRRLGDPISQADWNTLFTGTYFNPTTGETVKFILPQYLKKP